MGMIEYMTADSTYIHTRNKEIKQMAKRTKTTDTVELDQDTARKLLIETIALKSIAELTTNESEYYIDITNEVLEHEFDEEVVITKDEKTPPKIVNTNKHPDTLNSMARLRHYRKHRNH
jgi:hypothetical protein